MKSFFIITSLIFLIFSCQFKETDFNGIESYKIEKFENNEFLLNVSFKLNNENRFKIKVKPSKLKVFVEGEEMGTAFLDKKIIFKKKTQDVYQTNIRFALKEGAMFSAFKFMGKKELNVQFVGKVKGSVFGISKKFSVDETQTFNMRDLNLNQFFN